jgi:hypothetical protein
MSSKHFTAIEAAASELSMYLPTNRPESVAYIVEDVITAYQTAMAADVRAAVDRVVAFAMDYGEADDYSDDEERLMTQLNEAEAALLELVGATNAPVSGVEAT